MKAALWIRVSHTSGDQTTENQRMALEQWATPRGLEIVQVYDVEGSAWRGAHLKALSGVYADARARRFQTLLVWSLDRLSREGPLATLQIIDRLGKLGVTVLSYTEPWTEAPGELRDLLLAIAGWVARSESQRRSERTKIGLERVKAQGKKLGRPPGSQDKKARKKRGYFRRWDPS